jgi:hypothetical protein
MSGSGARQGRRPGRRGADHPTASAWPSPCRRSWATQLADARQPRAVGQLTPRLRALTFLSMGKALQASSRASTPGVSLAAVK